MSLANDMARRDSADRFLCDLIREIYIDIGKLYFQNKSVPDAVTENLLNAARKVFLEK